MSIYYVNPGFPSLMQEYDFFYRAGTSSNMTNCGQYFVPLNYPYWNKIYAKKMRNAFFRFDTYANLINEKISTREDFIKIKLDENHALTIGINSKCELCLTCNKTTVFKQPYYMGNVVAYALHLISYPTKEVIELYRNGKLIYTNAGKTQVYFHGQPILGFECKNIISIHDKRLIRHGMAFSNLIISDTDIINANCHIARTAISGDFSYITKTNDYATKKMGSELSMNIDLDMNVLEDNTVDAIAIVNDVAYSKLQNDMITYKLDGTTIGMSVLNEQKKKGYMSNLLEINPNGIPIWNKDTLKQTFSIVSGKYGIDNSDTANKTATNIVLSPKIVAVIDKRKGDLHTISTSTNRIVGHSEKSRNDTNRYVIRTVSCAYDTRRVVHNQCALRFDTLRLVNGKTIASIDTIRIVHSNLPVQHHSLYIQGDECSVIECTIFRNTDLFPYHDKYVQVLTDDGKTGYLPLVPIGSDYDSGLRYTADDGTIWQIASTVTYNLIDSYFAANNYFIYTRNSATATQDLFNQLRAVFDTRVIMDSNNDIYLTMPTPESGLTKMFCIGLFLEITWKGDENKSYNDGITLNTWDNGNCECDYSGDNDHKSSAMLVTLIPHTTYRIRVRDEYNGIKYNSKETIHNCIILGRTVETLSEKSDSYQPLIDTESYCCLNNTNSVIPADDSQDSAFYIQHKMKNLWLKYKGSNRKYNYYIAKNPQSI